MIDNENKVYAYMRKDTQTWWAVIDCGIAQKGGMTLPLYWFTHFKVNDRAFRYYEPIINPPPTLKDWDEIKVGVRKFCYIANDKDSHLRYREQFEGWEDGEDLGYKSLLAFGKLLKPDLTLEEVKDLCEKNK